jgi:hypothetical protein
MANRFDRGGRHVCTRNVGRGTIDCDAVINTAPGHLLGERNMPFPGVHFLLTPTALARRSSRQIEEQEMSAAPGYGSLLTASIPAAIQWLFMAADSSCMRRRMASHTKSHSAGELSL